MFGMIEASGGLGLVPQPLARLEVVSAGAEQELDRDRDIERGGEKIQGAAEKAK